jgi:hypothetical protein
VVFQKLSNSLFIYIFNVKYIHRGVVMTLEEVDKTDEWSNNEYFDYMKETGEWDAFDKQEHDAKPCDRCEHGVETTWKVESYFDVQDVRTKRYTIVTEFEICTLCMLELFGSQNPEGKKA